MTDPVRAATQNLLDAIEVLARDLGERPPHPYNSDRAIVSWDLVQLAALTLREALDLLAPRSLH